MLLLVSWGVSAAHKPKDSLVLIIDTFYRSSGAGDHEVIRDHLDDQFPESLIITIHADSNEAVTNGLAEVMARYPESSIQALEIDAHGHTFFRRGPLHRGFKTFEEAFHRYYGSTIDTVDSNFYVQLNQVQSIENVFSPIIGRFAPGAKVIMSSCTNAELGLPYEVALLMNQILLNFKIEFGSLYLNQTSSSRLVTGLMRPSWRQPTRREGLVLLGNQLLAVATYPHAFYSDLYLMNRGYLFQRFASGRYNLYREHLFQVEQLAYTEKRPQVYGRLADLPSQAESQYRRAYSLDPYPSQAR